MIYKYRLKKKTYFYYRVYLNGKQFARRFDDNKQRFINRRDAEIAESKFLNRIGGTTRKDVLYVYQLTDEFHKFLLSNYKTTTAFGIYRSYMRYVYPEVKNLKIKEFNLDTVKQLNNLIESYKDLDNRTMVSACKNLLKFASIYGVYLNPNLILRTRKFELGELKKYSFWTLQEFKQFISVVDDVYFKLLFSVLYYYGLRVGELRGLTKENFSSTKLIINQCISNKTDSPGQQIITPKSRSSIRSFPMFPFIYQMFEALQQRKESRKSKYIFYSDHKDSLVIGETSICRYMKKYCELSGVKKIKIHEFRHSCASLLINEGLDALQVSEWLGHSNPNITLTTYSHLFESRKNEIFNFLNKIGKE